jgi:hypothetical protein
MNSKKITNDDNNSSSTSSSTNNKNYSIDEAKLKDFMGKIVNDLGATESTVLVIIGDKLGLYKAMVDSKPVTPVELASRTGTTERYIREWLSNQAAGGYISYNPNTAKYALPPEQALWLMKIVLYFHLVVFKLLWHSLEMSPKLLRPSVLEKVLIGVIMILTCTKVLKDSINQIILLIL